MKIKVIKRFNDLENNLEIRKPGAELTVGEERGRELIVKGFAEEIKPKKTTQSTD